MRCLLDNPTQYPYRHEERVNHQYAAPSFQGQPPKAQAGGYRCERLSILIGYRAGLRDIIKLLFARGADLNFRDRHGRSPLHRATEKQNEAAIQQRRHHLSSGPGLLYKAIADQ